jgi:hypothetical protein
MPHLQIKKKISQFPLEILRTLMPQGVQVPIFEKYVEKGDPTNHVNAYTTICSDFLLDDKILVNIFPIYLRDTTLEWFSSLPSNSIKSFDELVQAFFNHLQFHMNPKLALADFMRCKKEANEKLIDFISRYQAIYSQIDVGIPNPHLQKMFVENLQRNIQDRLTMTKFPTFLHLCTTLCDYQNSVISCDANSTHN